MIDVNGLFAQAEAAFQAGQLDLARADLQQIQRLTDDHPAVLHLMALVEKQRGDLDAARVAFDRAMQLDPNDPYIANNAGNLLFDLGDVEAALHAYGRAITLAPTFQAARLNRAIALHKVKRFEDSREEFIRLIEGAESARAWSAKGALERDSGDLGAAAEAYDTALALDPSLPTALRGRARVALERGDKRATTDFATAILRLGEEPELVLGEAEALEAEGSSEATARLTAIVEKRPLWAKGQLVLARMRWEAGEGQPFVRNLKRAVKAAPRDRDLWVAYATTLAAVSLYEQAAEVAADARARLHEDAALQLMEAMYRSEAGDVESADRLFAALPARLPGRSVPELRHRIRQKDFECALALADAARAENKDDVLAWAHTDLLWRQMGDDRAVWLHGQPGLVAVQQLELSRFELAAIVERLRGFHRTRAHPIGQSLRGGTQTRGRLFERQEPEVAALRSAVSHALKAYRDSLPPEDPEHPLLRYRDRSLRFGGSWSVRLTDGGFHVAHVHPHGLLSSACYLALPKDCSFNERALKEGWLEIGRPPPELQFELDPVAVVKPEPGTLVLFPSTIFHGTCPFRSGERLTAAFDVIAA